MKDAFDMRNLLILYCILSAFAGIIMTLAQFSDEIGMFRPITQPLFSNENFRRAPRIILSVLLEVIGLGAELVRYTFTLLMLFIYCCWCVIMLFLEKDKQRAKNRFKNISNVASCEW